MCDFAVVHLAIRQFLRQIGVPDHSHRFRLYDKRAFHHFPRPYFGPSWQTRMLTSPPPQLGYIQNPLDRVHNLRETPGWVEELSAREDGLCVVLAGDRPLYFQRPGAAPDDLPSALIDAKQAAEIAPSSEVMFLGLEASGRPVYARRAVAIERDTEEDGGAFKSDVYPGFEHTDMRSLASLGVVPTGEVAIIALARSLMAWHESHRFCSKCGQPSEMSLGGYRRDCPSCQAQHFPRTDPVTIMLVTDGDRALMARSRHFIPQMYSAIAGFMEPGETIEDAVARETFEETGLRVGKVDYHLSQPWPFPSTLMIACFAEAETTELNIDYEELEDALWVSRKDLAAILNGDHEMMAPAPFAIAHHLVRSFVLRG